MEQLPLPGIPPAEEQASPEDTARVQLMFEGEDKVISLVVKALNHLFFAPSSATHGHKAAHQNCLALYREMLAASERNRKETS